jgi:hypothetical protein
MYLVSVINTKTINSITKLNGTFNHGVEGIPSSGVVDNKLQVIKVLLFCRIKGSYVYKALSSLWGSVDKDNDIIELANRATFPP